jgi:hypothetical protein
MQLNYLELQKQADFEAAFERLRSQIKERTLQRE